MKVKIENISEEYNVKIIGRLDTITAATFEKEIATLYSLAEPNIIVDCKELDYISSSGFRCFVTLQKYVTSKKGDLLFININDDIMQIFTLIGFTKIFNIK